MAQLIIAENAQVQSVSYALPNKHYIPVDMSYLGVENVIPCVFLYFRSPALLLFLIRDTTDPKQRSSCPSQLRGPVISF
jgi:urate oxidase